MSFRTRATARVRNLLFVHDHKIGFKAVIPNQAESL